LSDLKKKTFAGFGSNRKSLLCKLHLHLLLFAAHTSVIFCNGMDKNKQVALEFASSLNIQEYFLLQQKLSNVMIA
jgi:hypothetical protein